MTTNSNNNGCLWALLIVLCLPALIAIVPTLLGVFFGIFGVGMGLFGAGIGFITLLSAMLGAFLSTGWGVILIISLLTAFLLPIGFAIWLLVRLVAGKGLPKFRTWLIALLLWLLSLIGVVASGVKIVHDAGGIDALQEMTNQVQTWEYSWSNVDDNTYVGDADDTDFDEENFE